MIRDLHPIVQATLQICLTAVITLLLHLMYSLFKLLVLHPLVDPLRHLPGPEGSMLQSHLQQVMKYVARLSLVATREANLISFSPAFSAQTHQNWRTRFGQTFRFNGFGKVWIVNPYCMTYLTYASSMTIVSCPSIFESSRMS
jgi:hypothetical protein